MASIQKPTRNWLELPSDLLLNIIQRVNPFDILQHVEKVCTAWREICMDPAMWRVVYLNRLSRPCKRIVWQEMCKRVVDRSQGQLVDFTILGCNQEFLQYVVDRSSQLRRLVLVEGSCVIRCEALKKLSLLEELILVKENISQDDIEVVGRYCPLLKTLKVNPHGFKFWESMTLQNEIALAIGKNLPGLTHLALIRNSMTNIGLQAILDGCCRLESLDLRGCLFLDLKGDLENRCSKQIKTLKLPHDSQEDLFTFLTT